MNFIFYDNIILTNCDSYYPLQLESADDNGGVIMTKQSDSEEKKIINVVDEFDAAVHGSGYKGNFKEWRKSKDNPYAFNFEKNNKEKIFNESKGFETPSQER